MAAFTVVYIQLTALLVGAKYLKRGLIVMSKKVTKKERKVAKGMNHATMGFFIRGYKKPCLFFSVGTTYVNAANFGGC